MSRRPPLHTCAASFLAIIHTSCRKAQQNNGVLGKLAKLISKPLSIALPLVYAIQYQWLLILHFTDYWILKFEKLEEIIFPPSTILFDKIDEIVSTVEIIPEKFNDALNNRLSVNIAQANSFLEWAFLQIVIYVLDLSSKEEEKEIMMDMNSSRLVKTTESSSSSSSSGSEAKAKVKDDNCASTTGHEDQNQDQQSFPEVEKKTGSLSGKDKDKDKDKCNVELSGIDDNESGKKSVSAAGAPMDDNGGDDSCSKESGSEVEEEEDKSKKMKTDDDDEKSEKNGGEEEKEDKDPVLELFESKWLI